VKAWIEKIILEGFKSYGKERIEIPIGQGIVAVVGPNGAGKSNIGDALSFALGIATARALRAKNLTYLIYSKNSERADYAYVEVHFKNHGHFPIQEEDIVISRKVYQDGRSVFRINGAVVREKDLSDFLSKAGIYETAYNVVLQGDVVRFLRMTPVDRRKLIEEIAGIGEYEEKKQKALVDLGEVELKIRELRLLMDEIEVQIERLSQEVERLELYKKLEDRKRELEIRIYLKYAGETLRTLELIGNRTLEEEQRLEELKRELLRKEEELRGVEEELSKVKDSLLPFKERMGRLSQSIEYTDKKREEYSLRIEELQREKGLAQEQISSLEKEMELLKSEEDELISIIEGERTELSALEEQAAMLWRSIKEREEELKVSLDEIGKTEEKLRELIKLLEDRKRELSQLEFKLREIDMKKERVREDMRRLREEEELIKSKAGEGMLKRENYQKMLKDEERSIRAKKEEHDRVEDRLKKLRIEREEVLKEKASIITRLQNLPEESLPFEGIEGVYGKAGQLIRVKDMEYLRAVEAAGGARLSYVIVENEDVAKACIERLREAKGGRMNFIPLNKIKDLKLPPYPRSRGVIDFVVNLVEYDRRFEKAVRFIFGDTLLVESFEAAKNMGIGNYRMVTLEGDIFEKSGVISGGYVEARGELGRDFYLQELERLNLLEEKLREEEAKQESLLKAIRGELIEKEGVIRILHRRLEELEESEKDSLERVKHIQEKLSKAEEYLKVLEEERTRGKENMLKLKEEMVYMEEKVENLSVKRQSILIHYRESGVEKTREEYERIKQKIEKLRNSIHKNELRLKDIQSERENLHKETKRKLAFIASLEEEAQRLNIELEKLHREREAIQEELCSINAQAYQLYKARDGLEEKLKGLQSEAGRLRLQEENIKEELHKLSLERAKLQERYEESLERLRELGYEEDVAEVKESLGKLREELSRVTKEMTSLGTVNFRAEEEFRDYEERYKDYKGRYERLVEEKRSIKEMIEEIEDKKLRVFMETFERVNTNLKRIFSELSPGGKAYMVLEKEDDPLSGGVNLVVKPRGKEVQYLEAISGGEKTLAALALIFAIQDYSPSPFYYFDEVDAHLDEANARRVGELIKERSKKAQFIVVTLREVLASFADRLIGVSGRGGISKVFSLENTAQLLTG
jgi:chromosome segregation protein